MGAFAIKISVKYYGQLAEIADREEESYEVNADAKIGDLLSAVHRRHPEAGRVAISVACNDQFSDEGSPLNEGDRIDLFPPFAGG